MLGCLVDLLVCNSILISLQLLLSIPRLDALVSLFAKTTSSVLPKPVLRELISIVMKRPREEIIDITTEFMKSKCGPQQAM